MRVLIIFILITSSCYSETKSSEYTKEEILGTDTDKNGVRDDIDKYIDSLNYNSLTKKHLKLYVKYYTASIISYQAPQRAITSLEKSFLMSYCIGREIKDYRESMRIENHLVKKVGDTKTRILAQSKRDQNLSGWVHSSNGYKPEDCN